MSGINPKLAHIVKRCMAKNPSDRYTTASELFKDLTADFDDSVLRSGAQNYQIGDDYEEIQEPLSPKELALLLTPDIETSPDTEKKCRNCGLSAESNVLNCPRCEYSEWRASGLSVFADPFTLSEADKLGRKDKTREQAVFTKITLLTLLAISLSLGMAEVLIWSQHEDPALAGYEDLAEASAHLDLPLVKRLETASGNGETRVDLNPVDANVLGIDVLSFRARFGGIETAITLSTDLEDGDPPPEPVYRQFRADVFAQPDIAAERFIFRFHIPTTWLEQHDIEMPKVRLWAHNRSEWAPLETFNIAIEDGVATFLGFSPGSGDFAIGALP